MTLSSGTKLGPFEILAPVGAGGMGEVYKAKDTRLDRTVAIKVLRSHLSSDSKLKQRFEREARAISSLSHPHICTLYDVGEHDGTSFLVMEFLEGQTLAERLRKGRLAMEEALQFATQIADALDKAHRQGIVHRDLKPGNIMLTKAGVKLLDFGLAKSVNRAPDLRSPSPHPMGRGQGEEFSGKVTQKESELTKEGTILGTLSYMAPEQLEGKEADTRTDIFAFGVVLYEIVTGKKAFTGQSQASLMAAILEREPEPISKLQPMTPPVLDRVVRTCLAKDPDDRWQTAHDLKLQLKWIAEGGSDAGLPAPVVARRKSRERMAWAVAAVAIIACAALGVVALLRNKSSAPSGAVRFALTLPEKSTAHSFAVSPNGRNIALAAHDVSGTTMLWIRPLDRITAQPLTGTEGATYPFWSPDSRFIGFFANGKLKKIDTEGGPASTLCDARYGRGGAWRRDGTIVFAPDTFGRLHRVTAAGGAPSELTKLDRYLGSITHRWPQFLPDDTHVVYLEKGTRSGIHAASVDSGESKLLLPGQLSSAAYALGHLLFVRRGTLMAQPFDPGRLELKGEAYPLAEQVQYNSALFLSSFSVSQEGTLVYQSGSGTFGSQLVWLNREGNRLGTLGDPADQLAPSLSRDGKRANVTITDPASGRWDVWIYDLSRQVSVKTRFTFDAADDFGGVWSPDNSSIVFSSNRKGHYDLYQKSASGVSAEECLFENNRDKFAHSWSSDGQSVLYHELDAQNKMDLWVLPMTGDRKPYPLLKTPFDESRGLFSPDRKWIAYQSNESGQVEIYVNSFPKLGGKLRVSTAGGSHLRWPDDGKEIFYLAPDNRLMAAEVKPNGDALEVGQIHRLFQIRPGNNIQPYSTADGQKFLVNAELDQTNSLPVMVVLNWAAELKKK